MGEVSTLAGRVKIKCNAVFSIWLKVEKTSCSRDAFYPQNFFQGFFLIKNERRKEKAK